MNLANYNSTVLLIISVLSCSISTLSDGFFFKKNKVNKKSTYLFNSFYFLLTAFLIFALSGFKIKMSVYTLLLGLAFGVSTTLTALLGVFAIKKGPYGFTRVIINLSTAVTALSGYFFFNEELSLFKIIGIVLMLVCFFLAINLKDKDGKFFMVRQYRYVPGVELLEFPAGKIEINENPDNTILRECIEETGYSCKNLRKLDYMIPTCGYSSEKIYLYYGEVDEKVGQHFDVDEDLKLEKYSIEEIKEMVREGIISDGKTICLILKMELEGII
mgnify:CR=1 FL=1